MAYSIGQKVNVMYFGTPTKMIISEQNTDTKQWKCVWPEGQGYGSTYFSEDELDRHAHECAMFLSSRRASQLFMENYTDGAGNVFSDADTGF